MCQSKACCCGSGGGGSLTSVDWLPAIAGLAIGVAGIGLWLVLEQIAFVLLGVAFAGAGAVGLLLAWVIRREGIGLRLFTLGPGAAAAEVPVTRQAEQVRPAPARPEVPQRPAIGQRQVVPGVVVASVTHRRGAGMVPASGRRQ